MKIVSVMQCEGCGQFFEYAQDGCIPPHPRTPGDFVDSEEQCHLVKRDLLKEMVSVSEALGLYEEGQSEQGSPG